MIDHDPDDGLAGERTDLAWGRTGLSMVAILGTLLRAALRAGAAVQVAAVCLGVVGAVIWALGLRRAQALAETTQTGRHAAEERVLTLITGGTLAIALAAALVPH
jgi:uncharacterized membrane protein YidH (DUF202 family)